MGDVACCISVDRSRDSTYTAAFEKKKDQTKLGRIGYSVEEGTGSARFCQRSGRFQPPPQPKLAGAQRHPSQGPKPTYQWFSTPAQSNTYTHLDLRYRRPAAQPFLPPAKPPSP